MKHATIACGAVLWLVSGCSTVTLKEPIGQAPPPADLKALEGVWCNVDGDPVEVRLAKSGDLVGGGLEWDEDSQKFRADTARLVVTKIRDLRLLYLDPGEDSTDDGYGFCRYEIQDANLVRLHIPIASVFEQAVESGQLSGTIKRHPRRPDEVDVLVTAAAEDVDAFLEKSGDAACFEVEPFNTYKRLRRIE
jgi:hypothetical protein